MDLTKTISTVIPCYNAEKYLVDCIKSVLAQDYEPKEIICVNDGSTDGTLELLRSLKIQHSSQIKIIDITNAGASHARNVGLKNASGQYLQFLDADDVIASNKFSTQIPLLENSDMVVSDRIIKTEDLSHTTDEITFAHIETNPLEVAVREVIITGNPIYRTSLVKSIGGYREDLASAQDWDFHIRMILAKARVKYVSGYLFVSRRVPGSISSNWKTVSEQCCRVVKSNKDALLNHNSFNNSIRDQIAVIYYNSAIVTKDITLVSEYRNELQYWTQGSLTFINSSIKRSIAKMIGLETLIRIERMRN
ncbi:MAG: glycosyltransferase family 2 protein [Bacteroidia bacterium]|nr:glycosyltransferase family 2 protein [Bacteroidia bacterium]